MSKVSKHISLIFFSIVCLPNANSQFNSYWLEFKSNNGKLGNYLKISYPDIYWIESNSELEFQTAHPKKEICSSRSIYKIDPATFDSLDLYITKLFNQNYSKHSSKYLWQWKGKAINNGMNISRLRDNEVIYRLSLQDKIINKICRLLNGVKNESIGRVWKEHDTKNLDLFFPFKLDVFPNNGFDALYVTINNESFYITDKASLDSIKLVLNDLKETFTENVNCISMETILPELDEETYEIKLLNHGSLVRTYLWTKHYLINNSIQIWFTEEDLKSLFLDYREN